MVPTLSTRNRKRKRSSTPPTPTTPLSYVEQLSQSEDYHIRVTSPDLLTTEAWDLPSALLSRYSTSFGTLIRQLRASNSDSRRLLLRNTDPALFTLFVNFLFQENKACPLPPRTAGAASDFEESDASVGRRPQRSIYSRCWEDEEPVPRDWESAPEKAWVLGVRLGAKESRDYAMGFVIRTYVGSLPRYLIGVIPWAYENTGEGSLLRKFCVDAVAWFIGDGGIREEYEQDALAELVDGCPDFVMESMAAMGAAGRRNMCPVERMGRYLTPETIVVQD
ncbi:hypothetical protein H2201_001384 [Coniosporium apollinis]|uniref:BTB domain-containing protein n=1 Tax=Coniosporium apollinis TaxID=61459 RepID=A0ABQ9P2Y6_9PEZI|nr:hypothetical protein H2201_001384 [Coniosporium apollinis]